MISEGALPSREGDGKCANRREPAWELLFLQLGNGRLRTRALENAQTAENPAWELQSGAFLQLH
jgi:hypothetical protein